MTTLTDADLTALERFAKLPEGHVMMQLLTMRLADHDAKMRVATGEEVFRCQGRSQAVAQLIEDIKSAGVRRQRVAASPRQVNWTGDALTAQ